MPYASASGNMRCTPYYNNPMWLPQSNMACSGTTWRNVCTPAPVACGPWPTAADCANVHASPNANTNVTPSANAAAVRFGSFTSLLFGNDDATNVAYASGNENANSHSVRNGMNAYCLPNPVANAGGQCVPLYATTSSASDVRSANTCVNTNTATAAVAMATGNAEQAASDGRSQRLPPTLRAITPVSSIHSLSDLSEMSDSDSDAQANNDVTPQSAPIAAARDSGDSAFAGSTCRVSKRFVTRCDASTSTECSEKVSLSEKDVQTDRECSCAADERRLLRIALTKRDCEPLTAENAGDAFVRYYATACQCLAIETVDCGEKLCELEASTFVEFTQALVGLYSAAQFVSRDLLLANIGIVRSLEIWSDWSLGLSANNPLLCDPAASAARLAVVFTLCSAALSFIACRSAVSMSGDQAEQRLSERLRQLKTSVKTSVSAAQLIANGTSTNSCRFTVD